MIIDELIAILGFDVRGEEKLRSFSATIEQTAARIATFATAAAVASAGALAALGKSVINVSAQFESLEASLTTVTGSTEQAKASMDWITKFAAATPYEVNGITEAFIKLKSYGIDPIADDALRTLGDAASAMNKPLNQAVEALADATSFEFERLKEFGLRTQQKGNEVTFTWTKNGKELSKTIKKNSEDVRKFILEQLGDRFNGAMVRQSKTWNGMMSNLGDSWTSFLLRIGRGGFFEAVRGKLADLLDYFNRLAEDGTLDRWAKSISAGFTYVADGIANFAVRIGRHFTTIAKIIEDNKGAWDTFKWALLALGAYLFPVAALIGLAAAAVDDFLTYLRGGKSVIGDFVQALADFLGADPQDVAKVLGDIASAAAALAATAAGVGLFATALRKVGGALGLLGSSTAVDGIGNLTKAGEKVSKINGPKFGLLSMLGLESALEMGSGTLEEGKARGNAWNKWLENSMGTPRSYLERLMGGSGKSDQPKIPYGALTRDPSAHGDALMDNAAKNFGRMGSGAAAAINSTVNDNSNRSVNVNVGGVTVQGVPNVSGAVGAAVGQAVGSGAAAGAKRAPWHELGEKF